MPLAPEDDSTPAGPSAESRSLLAWTIGAFVLTFIGLALSASLLTPDVEPGYPATETVEALPDGSFQITLGVQDRDQWVGLNLGSGTLATDAQLADLRFRRYIIRAPGGAAALGEGPLETATLPANIEWEYDVNVDGTLQNPAVARWYEYGWQSHLLSTKGELYAVKRTTGEGHAVFTVVSYYCEPDGSGCMTVRYKLLP